MTATTSYPNEVVTKALVRFVSVPGLDGRAALITLGLCYQVNGRFSGGAYHSILKRCDKFLAAKLPNALITRRERAERVLELNELVNEAVKGMKSRGLESPYLKAFVVARINPLRFQRKPTADFDETIDKMIGSARRFDAGKIRADQIARSGGPPAVSDCSGPQ